MLHQRTHPTPPRLCQQGTVISTTQPAAAPSWPAGCWHHMQALIRQPSSQQLLYMCACLPSLCPTPLWLYLSTKLKAGLEAAALQVGLWVRLGGWQGRAGGGRQGSTNWSAGRKPGQLQMHGKLASPILPRPILPRMELSFTAPRATPNHPA